MKHETILVLDFGGQYNQLIARRVRDLGVYCEVHPYQKAMEKIRELSPIGIIFTGGPNSVYEPGAPRVDPAVFGLGIPILGLCYGLQMMSHSLGGEVTSAETREFGKTPVHYDTESPLFQGLPQEAVCWMSHVDYVSRLPEGFTAICHTAATANAGIQCKEKKLYGVQFHPEVEHTQFGSDILRNFLYEICGAGGDWTMRDYARNTVEALREKIGGIMFLQAIDYFTNDPETEVVVMVSKPPHPSVAKKIYENLPKNKPSVIFFLGGNAEEIKAAGAYAPRTLEEAAIMAVDLVNGRIPADKDIVAEDKAAFAKLAGEEKARLAPAQKYMRGLFCGGTHSEEAVTLLQEFVPNMHSNIAFGKVDLLEDRYQSLENSLVDMGDEVFTKGKPHPVMDPSILVDRMIQEARDPEVGVILFDLLYGHAIHPDPVGAIEDALKEIKRIEKEEGPAGAADRRGCQRTLCRHGRRHRLVRLFFPSNACGRPFGPLRGRVYLHERLRGHACRAGACRVVPVLG